MCDVGSDWRHCVTHIYLLFATIGATRFVFYLLWGFYFHYIRYLAASEKTSSYCVALLVPNVCLNPQVCCCSENVKVKASTSTSYWNRALIFLHKRAADYNNKFRWRGRSSKGASTCNLVWEENYCKTYDSTMIWREVMANVALLSLPPRSGLGKKHQLCF